MEKCRYVGNFMKYHILSVRRSMGRLWRRSRGGRRPESRGTGCAGGLRAGAVLPAGPGCGCPWDAAVEQYEVVIAYAEEAELAMPEVDIGAGDCTALGRGRAVDDDFCNLTHSGFRLDGSHIAEHLLASVGMNEEEGAVFQCLLREDVLAEPFRLFAWQPAVDQQLPVQALMAATGGVVETGGQHHQLEEALRRHLVGDGLEHRQPEAAQMAALRLQHLGGLGAGHIQPVVADVGGLVHHPAGLLEGADGLVVATMGMFVVFSHCRILF